MIRRTVPQSLLIIPYKLVYNYAYFTKYDMGIINNDWGTVRLIDENGNAIPIK